MMSWTDNPIGAVRIPVSRILPALVAGLAALVWSNPEAGPAPSMPAAEPGADIPRDTAQVPAGCLPPTLPQAGWRSQEGPDTPRNTAQVLAAFARSPMSFEANVGQAGEPVRFLARGCDYTLFLTTNEIVLAVRTVGRNSSSGPAGDADGEPEGELADSRLAGHPKMRSRAAVAGHGPGAGPALSSGCAEPAARVEVLRLRFLGANRNPEMLGESPLPGVSHYYLGRDPSQWRTGIAHYARVRYQEVYPGIDLVYYGNQRQLEYDLVLSPGSDPSKISFTFEDARGRPVAVERIDEDGSLILRTAAGEVRQHRPLVYQEMDGTRREVPGRYVLLDAGRIGFSVADYDRERRLVIDPVLSYSTLIGGSLNEDAFSIAVTSDELAVITGETASTNFPLRSEFDSTLSGPFDAYVTKFDPFGSNILFSTFLGGSSEDRGFSVRVDASGNMYVAGETSSTNFPTAGSPIQSTLAGDFDAFVCRLTSSGSLSFSTYLGGTLTDSAFDLAVDASGNFFVTGLTRSTNFPVTEGAFQSSLAGSFDAFVSKIPSTGGSLAYSSFHGGTADDRGFGIAVDSAGNAFLAGRTSSSNFPTAGSPPFQSSRLGLQDGFVTKINSGGTARTYSTFLGGSNIDDCTDIALDSAGNAYVTGSTTSTDFPRLNPFQASLNRIQDAFVTKLNSSGSALVYSTYLGGSDLLSVGQEGGVSIAVDSSGSAHVVGTTNSSDFPVSNAIQGSFGGGQTDAFITKLNAAGNALTYSTFLGGILDDGANAITLDAAGNAYVAGFTLSGNFPTANGFDATQNGGVDAFVARIADPPTSSQTLFGADGAEGNSVVRLFTLNPQNGSFVQIIGQIREDEEITLPITGLAFHPTTGVLFGVTGDESQPRRKLVTINPTTAAGTTIGELSTFSPSPDISFRSDGILFGWLRRTVDDLCTINLNTGLAAVVGDSGLSNTRGDGLAFSPTGTLFFAGNNVNGLLRTIDPATGAVLTSVQLSGGGTSNDPINALAFDASGTLFGSVKRSGDRMDLVTINTTTGVVTILGRSVDNLDAIVFSTTQTADLSITKSGSPDVANVDENITYTLTVQNSGPSDATSVVVTDELPVDAIFVSASSTQGTVTGSPTSDTVSASLGTVRNGETATVTIIATADLPGVLTNTASVTSGVFDPDSSDNIDTATTSVNGIVGLLPTRALTTGGRPVVVFGENLDTITRVEVDGRTVSGFVAVSSTVAIFFTPPGVPGFVDLEVTFGGGSEFAFEDAFRYVPPITRSFPLEGGDSVDDYRMVGIPLAGGTTSSGVTDNSGSVRLNSINSLVSQFLGQLDFTDPKECRIFRFNGFSYDEGLDIRAGDFFEGMGFWIIAAKPTQVDLTGGDTNQFVLLRNGLLSPSPPIALFLHSGWNQVSPGVSGVRLSPDAAFVSNGELQFPVTSGSNTLTSRSFFEFTGDVNNPYAAASALDGEDAYWIFNFSSVPVVLFFGDPDVTEVGADRPTARSRAVRDFLQSDLAAAPIGPELKYVLTGNVQGVTRAVSRAEGDTPPPPPASMLSGSAGGGGGGGGGCFIATAAWGTPLDARIRALSRVRDEDLAPAQLGVDFTATYYGNAPAAASCIRGRATLRAVARRFLCPMARAAER